MEHVFLMVKGRYDPVFISNNYSSWQNRKAPCLLYETVFIYLNKKIGVSSINNIELSGHLFSGFFFPALLIVKLLDIKQLSTMSLYHKNFILIHHQSIYYKMKESILFYISTGTAAPS